MYIIACRAHFCHLLGLGQVGHSPRETSGSDRTLNRVPAWPWWGRSLPKGNQWECWDPGLGPNVVGLPVHLPAQYTTNTPYKPPYPRWQVGWAPNLPATPNAPLTPPTNPIPLLAHMHLHSLPPPQCTPDTPYTLQAPYMPAGPWVPTLPASPAMHPWHPYTPDSPNAPTPLGTSMPPDSPICLLAPEHLHSLPPP